MKKYLLILGLFCFCGMATGQNLSQIHTLQLKPVIDSNYIFAIANPSSGFPYKATVGGLVNSYFSSALKTVNDSSLVGIGNIQINHGYLRYATNDPTIDSIPVGTFKIYKNFVTDSVHLYINDSTSFIKIPLGVSN